MSSQCQEAVVKRLLFKHGQSLKRIKKWSVFIAFAKTKPQNGIGLW
jgi:hypothetical protein